MKKWLYGMWNCCPPWCLRCFLPQSPLAFRILGTVWNIDTVVAFTRLTKNTAVHIVFINSILKNVSKDQNYKNRVNGSPSKIVWGSEREKIFDTMSANLSGWRAPAAIFTAWTELYLLICQLHATAVASIRVLQSVSAALGSARLKTCEERSRRVKPSRCHSITAAVNKAVDTHWACMSKH